MMTTAKKMKEMTEAMTSKRLYFGHVWKVFLLLNLKVRCMETSLPWLGYDLHDVRLPHMPSQSSPIVAFLPYTCQLPNYTVLAATVVSSKFIPFVPYCWPCNSYRTLSRHIFSNSYLDFLSPNLIFEGVGRLLANKGGGTTRDVDYIKSMAMYISMCVAARTALSVR
jgi:hypothetical protein